MAGGWDFADPVDILPKLPKNFQEMVASKKWQERKEALEELLTLATDNIRLDPTAHYNEITNTLSKILAKDANINVCAVAAKCITQLAKGLRTKFSPLAVAVTPVIFEKFKEKKSTLRDPLIETIDAVYASTNIDAICDHVAAALGKPNPNIKTQTNQFLYRVFKAFNAQTAPKKVIKVLTPLIAKSTGDSDAEVREAAYSALAAIMNAIGKPNTMPMLGDVASDKTKMEQIDKCYAQVQSEIAEEKKHGEELDGIQGDGGASSEDFIKLQNMNTKLIAEKVELKTRLDKALAEKGELKARFDKALAEKGELKTRLDKTLAEKDELKTRLDKALAENKKKVTQMEHASMKSTRPLNTGVSRTTTTNGVSKPPTSASRPSSSSTATSVSRPPSSTAISVSRPSSSTTTTGIPRPPGSSASRIPLAPR